MADGHSDAFANCVVDGLGTSFQGAELRFAIAMLSLSHPSWEQTQAAVDASGIRRESAALLPDRVSAVEDLCRSVEVDPAVGTTPSSLSGPAG